MPAGTLSEQRAIDAARAERFVTRMRELPAMKDTAELAALYA